MKGGARISLLEEMRPPFFIPQFCNAMTTNITIRPFEPHDEPAIIDLWQTVFLNDPPWNKPADVIAQKLNVQRELFLVGVVSDQSHSEQLVGTVLAGYDGVRGWIHKLAVNPEYQQRGFASDLMQAAELRLIQMGCPKINLQIRASNAAVLKFYESAGYAVEDRLSMGKRLEP